MVLLAIVIGCAAAPAFESGAPEPPPPAALEQTR
jgi:hypothetical protein